MTFLLTPPAISTTVNILVFRPGALGDVISTLPALAAMRSYFPQSRLEVVGTPLTLELLKETGYADAVHSFDRASFAGLYSNKCTKLLKDFLFRFDYIIAYVGDDDFLRNLREIARCPVVSVHPREIPATTHIVDHLLSVLAQLGIPPLRDRTPYLQLPAGWQSAAEEFLTHRFPQKTVSPLIGVHPGSGGKKKIWPHWRNFIRRLVDEKGLNVLIFCGPCEGEEIINLRENRLVAKCLVENPPLLLLGALIGKCDLFLGNDSGVTHLAAATRRRTIALFGPSDPDTWTPRGDTFVPSLRCATCSDDATCTHPHCLENFHPDTLWNMVQSEI